MLSPCRDLHHWRRRNGAVLPEPRRPVAGTQVAAAAKPARAASGTLPCVFDAEEKDVASVAP